MDESILKLHKEAPNRNIKNFYIKINEHNKTFKGKIRDVTGLAGLVHIVLTIYKLWENIDTRF